MSAIPLGGASYLQSHYLLLQAAGSDGSDETVPGIHLRWDLLNQLGHEHIPKGNLSTEEDYQTTIGFNKANDFVKIYRAPYNGDYPVEVNFSSAPTAINEGFAGYREWRYENLEPYLADTQLRTHIIIRFRDIDTYDTLRDQIDPATNPLQFMTAYSGTIEVEAENKLSFAGAIHRGTGGEELLILLETISKGEPFDADPLIISSRSELAFDGEGEAQVICENIKYFRFTKNSQPIQRIVVETYEDFIRGKNSNNTWSEVGPSTGFGLSINQTELQTRLEDSSRFTVNQEWPKFNGGDAMLVSNYTDRWFSPGGVRDGVIEYLVASVDDVRAVKQYASDNPDSDLGIALSLLDGLKMVALDYHNARMLGLAYIDTDIDPDLPGQRYIYLAEYFTHDGLEKVPANQATIQHLYCSIPTHLQNYRLPKNPVLNPLGYGLQINTVSGEWVTISDDEGYAPNGDARFVNLHSAKEDLFEPFKLGVGGEFFNMCDHTEPIFHGVEYREEGQVAWQPQELSYDPDYNGYNAGTPGLKEVVPIANKDNPVFTHRETQEGIHEYGLYSINWFSRVSGLSNVRATSETAFPISKSLLPPANLAAHYIQEEHPIVLSTEAEQDALADRKQSNPTGDNYETRALFYWNQVHNINYAFADTVEFLFRLEAPLNVRGEIRSATTNPSDPALIDIETLSIEMPSRGLDGSGQIPKVDPDFNGQSGRFIGGNLVCDGRSYTILAIDDTGTFPVITIQPLRDYEAIHTEHNRFSPIVNQLKPDAGSRFEATENLSDMDNWTVLQKDVALIHQSQHSETKVLDGKQVTQVMGGVYDWASIEPVPDVYDIDDQENGNIPPGSQIGDPIPGSKSGIFKVDFHSYVLDDHPDPEVSWYRGTVRVLRDGYPDKKMIEVVKIESYTTEIYEGVIQVPEADTGDYKLLRSVKTEQYDSGQLQIYVEDPDHETSPIDTGTGKSITYLAGTSQASADQMATDGQADTATIEAIPKVYTHHDDIPADSEVGDPIPGTTSGLYRIGFDTHIYQQHPSTQASVLRLYVYDPDFDSDPILTGASLPVNFHPGYRLYLEAETAQGDIFNKENIQPTGSERLKKTWFSTRAKDSSTQVFSTPARPVPLLGRKVVPPEPPAEPSGPLYATRPDYYGKASYTFDVPVNVDAQREPYALQFLKANEEAILFALYTKATRDSIRAALPKPMDDTFFTQRWYDLVNVILENNQFKTYAGDPTGFNFPNPDNPDYYYLSNPMDPASKVYPFDGAPDPGTIEEAVREAIISAFVPLTEQLVVYEQISDADRQTSPEDPVTQDQYGDPLPVTDPAYNPFPMVRKFEDTGEHYVRFTDYRLDGAAQNWYFYLAREVSDSMEMSEDSPVAGPIQLVNTRPPAAPKVQQLTTRLANPITGDPPAIQFEMAIYPDAENISQVAIYRALTEGEALSIRTMQKAAAIPYGDPVVDDFSDLPVPPYGQPIYYRLVAQREITNEDGNIELVPSEPSGISVISVVDNINPEPPELSYTAGTLANGELPDVLLEWNKTVHNGKYYLYKMNDKGNWTKIYEVETNDAAIQVDLANTALGSNVLEKEEDGDTIYHRFKMDVENASGLMNTFDRILVI